VPPRPPPVQVRTVSQVAPEQHACPAPAAGSQLRPASLHLQTSLPAVPEAAAALPALRSRSRARRTRRRTGVTDAGPAWQTPLLFGSRKPLLMQNVAAADGTAASPAGAELPAAAIACDSTGFAGGIPAPPSAPRRDCKAVSGGSCRSGSRLPTARLADGTADDAGAVPPVFPYNRTGGRAGSGPRSHSRVANATAGGAGCRRRVAAVPGALQLRFADRSKAHSKNHRPRQLSDPSSAHRHIPGRDRCPTARITKAPRFRICSAQAFITTPTPSAVEQALPSRDTPIAAPPPPPVTAAATPSAQNRTAQQGSLASGPQVVVARPPRPRRERPRPHGRKERPLVLSLGESTAASGTTVPPAPPVVLVVPPLPPTMIVIPGYPTKWRCWLRLLRPRRFSRPSNSDDGSTRSTCHGGCVLPISAKATVFLRGGILGLDPAARGATPHMLIPTLPPSRRQSETSGSKKELGSAFISRLHCVQ